MPLPSLTRREILSTALAVVPAWSAVQPRGVIVDAHVHLFASDAKRFPYAPDAPYKPPPHPLESYAEFARLAKIEHAVIVHPEPYQDNHRYLEFCFANEPQPNFFKGTCLFDPVAPSTPSRLEELVKRNPGRIVALRIHEMHKPGTPSLTSGPIKDRDMRDPRMRTTWQKVQTLGLAIQMHFIPYYAPQIGELARQFPDVPIVLDHLGRAGQGTPTEFAQVLKLANFPEVYMKYSGVEYSSHEKYPYRDVKPIVKAAFDAFGPDRLIWGAVGSSMAEFNQQLELLDTMFDYASEVDRTKIRGGNAIRLFRW